MRRRTPLTALAVGVLLAGCTGGADPSPAPPPPSPSEYGGPASLAHPLGAGPLGVDQRALRDALLDEVVAAGGVRSTVTGSGYDTVVEVDPSADDRQPDPRRFTWQQDGVEREQLHLAGGRVCVNRASNAALETMLSAAMHGTIVLSERAYSCTPRSMSGTFLSGGLARLDLLSLVAGIDEWTGMTDRGTETGPDGVTTRHLGFDGVRGFTMQEPTPWELWIDGDLRISRIESAGLIAELGYGPVPEIALPPERDRGEIALVTYPVGSYQGPRGPAPTTDEPGVAE